MSKGALKVKTPDGFRLVGSGLAGFTEADKQEIVSLVLANFTDVSEVGM